MHDLPRALPILICCMRALPVLICKDPMRAIPNPFLMRWVPSGRHCVGIKTRSASRAWLALTAIQLFSSILRQKGRVSTASLPKSVMTQWKIFLHCACWAASQPTWKELVQVLLLNVPDTPQSLKWRYHSNHGTFLGSKVPGTGEFHCISNQISQKESCCTKTHYWNGRWNLISDITWNWKLIAHHHKHKQSMLWKCIKGYSSPFNLPMWDNCFLTQLHIGVNCNYKMVDAKLQSPQKYP